jgi:hypothetical protein
LPGRNEIVGFEHRDAPVFQYHVLENLTRSPIHYYDANGTKKLDPGPDPYGVSWMTRLVLQGCDVNYNLYKDPSIGRLVKKCLEEETVIFGDFEAALEGNISSLNMMTALFSELLSIDEEHLVSYLGDPMARLFLPVYDNFKKIGKLSQLPQQ